MAKIIVVGGGHNGLVCAYYLAKQGHSVQVYERREVVGGAAVTEEFHTGFRNSVAAYTVSLLNPKVIADMALPKFGLRIIQRPMDNFLPIDDKNYLLMGGGLARKQQQVAKFSTDDAKALPTFYRRLDAIADILRETLLQPPPNIGDGWLQLLPSLKLGNKVRKLGLTSQQDLLDFFGSSAGHYLERFFTSEPIKALLGFDAVVGNFGSPYDTGSAYVLLHHVFGEVNGVRGAWGHAVGGMGAITQAMQRVCEAQGVEFFTSSPVRQILSENRQVKGVLLEDGREVKAATVVANVNPRLLYCRMIDAAELDDEFLSRMHHWKGGSGTFRMNVALSALPDFTCLPGTHLQPHHSSGIVIAPSLAYMDRAYLDARRDGWSRKPIVEILIPSTIDDSLAPPGKHVASLFCQHFSPHLPEGKSWDDCRELAAQNVIDTVTDFAPNFRNSIIAKSILSPLDLERTFGMLDGDIFHGKLTLDQMFSSRPMLGHARYRGPLAGLYMCGSGTHPGGGVTGAPGHNAATEILKDLR